MENEPLFNLVTLRCLSRYENNNNNEEKEQKKWRKEFKLVRCIYLYLYIYIKGG